MPISWELELVARVLLSIALGAIIGIERESLNKSAGFRTHVLVAMGSCLFTAISISMPFVKFPTEAVGAEYTMWFRADGARIAAQVVSGIGFLGAGAIMRSGMNVRGLTTAASLWAIAAIGMAAGAGLYITAIAGTILIYVSLTYFVKLEARFRLQKQLISVVIHFSKGATEPLCSVFSMCNSMNVSVKNTRLLSDGDDASETEVRVELLVKLPIDVTIETLTQSLEGLPDITKAELSQG